MLAWLLSFPSWLIMAGRGRPSRAIVTYRCRRGEPDEEDGGFDRHHFLDRVAWDWYVPRTQPPRPKFIVERTIDPVIARDLEIRKAFAVLG